MRHTKLTVLISILCLVSTFASAQIDSSFYRSLVKEKRFPSRFDKITSSKAYQMTCVGVPLVVGGLILKPTDTQFRDLRNSYIPGFRNPYDDYLQYAPAAVMLGLKLGGVESRSSWPRMLVSDAFSVGVMALVVNVIKHSASVTRPDDSNDHSFPSGHTATAFMAATMMHKEYGGRSPWYSIGAYTVATATGLSRIANNKHWLSDIMVGAGIGVLSTELGYFLADLIFKERGITHFPVYENRFDEDYRPSFAGVNLGLNFMLGAVSLPDGSEMKMSTGSSAGLEGAYFFTPNWGVGGRFSLAYSPLSVNGIEENNALNTLSGAVGAYYSYPATSRILLGTKALLGYAHYNKCTLSRMDIGATGGVTFGTGISVSFLLKHNLGMKIFGDYNLLPPVSSDLNKVQHLLVAGASANILF